MGWVDGIGQQGAHEQEPYIACANQTLIPKSICILVTDPIAHLFRIRKTTPQSCITTLMRVVGRREAKQRRDGIICCPLKTCTPTWRLQPHANFGGIDSDTEWQESRTLHLVKPLLRA